MVKAKLEKSSHWPKVRQQPVPWNTRHQAASLVPPYSTEAVITWPKVIFASCTLRLLMCLSLCNCYTLRTEKLLPLKCKCMGVIWELSENNSQAVSGLLGQTRCVWRLISLPAEGLHPSSAPLLRPEISASMATSLRPQSVQGQSSESSHVASDQQAARSRLPGSGVGPSDHHPSAKLSFRLALEEGRTTVGWGSPLNSDLLCV